MATGHSNDYTYSCRLCLSKEGRQCAVFGPAPEDIGPLSARIFSCLSIDISEYDDLPKQICHRCECQINLWHYFKVECEVSQRKLMAWSGAHTSSSFEKEGTCVEECSGFQEFTNIKLEPEDVELHTDQNINSVHLHQPEEADSTHSHLIHKQGVLDQGPTYSSNETTNCLNLVISGTTSVDPNVHEGLSVEDGEPEPLAQVPVRSQDTSEVTLDDEADAITQNNEILPYPKANAKGQDEAESSKGNLQEETIAPVERLRSFDVKSEHNNARNVADFILQNPLPSSKRSLSRSSSRPLSPFNQISSSTSTITSSSKKRARLLSIEPKNKKPRLSDNISEYSRVPNNSLELPKITNEFYDENTSTCKICEKPFSNISNLWRHIKERHTDENPFRCGVCRKDFCGRRELIAHRLGTINKYCRLGKKPEVNMASLITTNPKVKSGTRGKYECSECHFKFSIITAAKAHERIHTGEKPFICFKCNEREFRLRKTALKHVTLCGGKPQSQIFLEDQKILSSASATVPKLVLHNIVKKSRVVKGKPCKVSKCPKCGKSFANGVGLSNHLRTKCSRKCISCLKFIPCKSFFKHYRQCFKAAHSSSTPSKSFADNSSNVNDDNTVVKNEGNSESNASEGPQAETTHLCRKLRRFDMTISEMWKKQLNEDGTLISLTCVFCGRTSTSRKLLYAHISKHSAKRFRVHSSNGANSTGSYQDANSFDLCSTKRVSSLVKARSPGKFPGFKRPKLKCDICIKVFTSASSLEYHKLTHKKIKCEKCELSFPASMERTHLCTSRVKTELVLGLVQLSGNEPSILPEKRVIQYTCLLCKKKFHTRKMLYQHKKMHIKVKIFKCKMCNNSYSDAGALKVHKEEDHRDESEEFVTDAYKELIQNESVEMQSSLPKCTEALGGKPFFCHVCHKGYSTEGSLDRHMKLHENVSSIFAVQKPSDPGVFYCNICDKAFTSFASFTRHKGWHSRISSESTPKSEVLSSSDDTPDHVKSTEPQRTSDAIETNDVESLPSFRCPLCPKMFAAQKNLKIHIHYHKNPKFQSPKETKTETVNHVETIHKCEICLSTFSDLSTFSSHMDTHTEKSSEALNAPLGIECPKQEPLHCKLCNKEYKNKKYLNYHMMGHSGEKPYKCKSCSNQYSNPKALSKHEKERHSIVLHPFSCNRCKTSFLLREDLLAHQEKCPH